MYLLSLYFDEKTNDQLSYLKRKLGYGESNIPFHITLSSFSCEEKKALEILEQISFSSFELQFASIGFLSSSMHITPILNDDLYQLQRSIYPLLKDVKISPFYTKENWLCHMTLCKHLNKEELIQAYKNIQYEFKPFKGKVVKLGLAKSNPYTDIRIICSE